MMNTITENFRIPQKDKNLESISEAIENCDKIDNSEIPMSLPGIQPDGSANSANNHDINYFNDKVTDKKMNKLKSQHNRLLSMSQDVSKKLTKANDDISKKDEDTRANANFLKAMNEKININDMKITKLSQRVEQLEKENKYLKDKIDNQAKETISSASNQLEPPRTVNKEKRRQIPIHDVSPGEGDRDESEEPPPMNWAYVANRGFKKPKKKQIPEQVLQQNPDIIPTDADNPEHKVVYTEEQKLNYPPESARTIGLKPLTQDDIDIETNILTNLGMPGSSKRDIQVTATQNLVVQFLRKT